MTADVGAVTTSLTRNQPQRWNQPRIGHDGQGGLFLLVQVDLIGHRSQQDRDDALRTGLTARLAGATVDMQDVHSSIIGDATDTAPDSGLQPAAGPQPPTLPP